MPYTLIPAPPNLVRDKENSTYLLGISSLPAPFSRKGRLGGIIVVLEGGMGQAQGSLALSPSLRVGGRLKKKPGFLELGVGSRQQGTDSCFPGTPRNQTNGYLDCCFPGLT